jgi:hypothetical protein
MCSRVSRGLECLQCARLEGYPIVCPDDGVLETVQVTLVYTVKKASDLSVPSQPGCHLSNSPWPGLIKLFPARIVTSRLGTSKSLAFFYSVHSCSLLVYSEHVSKKYM